jgi:hypothetical protein
MSSKYAIYACCLVHAHCGLLHAIEYWAIPVTSDTALNAFLATAHKEYLHVIVIHLLFMLLKPTSA